MRMLFSGLTYIGIAGLLTVTSTFAAGKIYYGSRAGMTVTIKSMSGLDTSQAVIQVEHTRDDAIGFCRDYAQEDPVTDKCIENELASRLSDAIYADCPRGVFTDFFGDKYQFRGRNPKSGDFGPKYLLMDLRTNEIADGSSASGYEVNLDIFRALCPRTAPSADTEANIETTPSTITPSFNCRYAKTPDEVVICQNPTLSEMDVKLAKLYFGYRNLISGLARHRLELDQATWLQSRMSCGRDVRCVAKAYKERVDYLYQHSTPSICGGPIMKQPVGCDPGGSSEISDGDVETAAATR